MVGQRELGGGEHRAVGRLAGHGAGCQEQARQERQERSGTKHVGLLECVKSTEDQVKTGSASPFRPRRGERP
jgi:hypothetical protein